MSLGRKLVASFLACGLVPLGTVAYISYRIADRGMGEIKERGSADLEQKAGNQLVALRDVKTKQVEEFCADRLNDVRFLADNPAVLDGMMASCVECHDVGDHATIREVSDSDARRHQAWLDHYSQECGYNDLYLITHTGQVVYTKAKRSDLKQNLVEGSLKNSPLGRCFEKSMKNAHFEDFARYEPAGNEPAAFIGAPVREQDKTIGVLAMQIAGAAINRITMERAGMGETGETYLVGTDNLMRSDSCLDPGKRSLTASFADPQKGSVNTTAVQAALAGQAGVGVITGYQGEPVLSAWAPVKAGEVTWALLAEVSQAEAMAAVAQMDAVASAAGTELFTWVGACGAAAAIGVGLASILIARSLSRPMNRVIAGLNEGADQVNDAAGQVSSASQQLAEGASEQASSLEETSSALEQMGAMSRTNTENAKQANDLSEQARTAAQGGDKTVEKLNAAMTAINESSGQISKIIKVIEEIAFQTNLLALNAAVEAARAGEHGKGFAVVADEVRNLAQRAAQAARETTSLIEGSVRNAQEGTKVAGDVGTALGAIVADVTKVADLVNGITKASEEQTQGVDQINTAVSQMDKVTQQNASGAEESASAAEELAAQAANVRGMVDELAALVAGTRSKGQAREESSSLTAARGMRGHTKVTTRTKALAHAAPAQQHWAAPRSFGPGKSPHPTAAAVAPDHETPNHWETTPTLDAEGLKEF